MSRPSQSVTGWASGGVIATSILPAEVALGQQTADPVPAAWINLFGAWIGYIEGFTPSDDVWNFREWECPDDSAYDLRWSGSTDGLLEGTLDAMQIEVSDGMRMDDGGSTASARYALGVEATSSLGWTWTGAALEQGTAATARDWVIGTAEKGAVSGIGIMQVDGSAIVAGLTLEGFAFPALYVEGGANTSINWREPDQHRYQRVHLPAASAVLVASAPSDLTRNSGGGVTIDGGSTGSSLVVADLHLPFASQTSVYASTLHEVRIVHGAVTGTATGKLIFLLVSTDTAGAEVTHASGTLTVGDGANTLTLGNTASLTIPRGAALRVVVFSDTADASVDVSRIETDLECGIE